MNKGWIADPFITGVDIAAPIRSLFTVVVTFTLTYIFFFHCGLVTPYSDIDLGQGEYWLTQWLVAWRHQTNPWTNVNLLSVRLSVTFIRG